MPDATTLAYPQVGVSPGSVLLTDRKRTVRYVFPDFVRGLTLCNMMVYHFLYDLNVLKLASFDFQNTLGFVVWQKLRVFLFIAVFGMCLREAYLGRFSWRRYAKRLLRLGSAALLVTVATYYAFPENWVYFGILHFAFLCSILGLPFIKIPKTSLSLAGAILFCYYGLGYKSSILERLIDRDGSTMDYQPLYPLFSYVLIGIFLHSIGLHKISLGSGRFVQAFSFLGRHALKLYLIHQPVLYGLAYLFTL
jgi:uncharacterized membrane protein